MFLFFTHEMKMPGNKKVSLSPGIGSALRLILLNPAIDLLADTGTVHVILCGDAEKLTVVPGQHQLAPADGGGFFGVGQCHGGGVLVKGGSDQRGEGNEAGRIGDAAVGVIQPGQADLA